jgi:ser/thr/tyr protein kinase RAD53
MESSKKISELTERWPVCFEFIPIDIRNKYKYIEQLFETTYGNILVVEYNEIQLVMKVLENNRSFRTESDILNICDHPQIVKPIDIYQLESHEIIIMKYYKEGDLFDEIQKTINISEKKTKEYTKQLVEILKYLHQKRIAHLDVKQENLMLDEGKLVMIDFNLSQQIPEGEEYIDGHRIVGSVGIISPEVVHYRNYYMKSDVWSLGVFVYICMTGTLPFGHAPDMIVRPELRNRVFNEMTRKQMSEDAYDFLRFLLVIDVDKRPNIWEVAEHKWLTS